MAILKTQGVVIRDQDLGETSKIITLYTRDFGKLKLVAKGARSLKSRFGGSLDLLNHISIVFYHRESRDIQFLSQSDIIRSFPRIKAELERLALAMAVCELIGRTEIGSSPNPQLFKLLVDTLKGMDESRRVVNYFHYFRIQFLRIAGFQPQLDRCLRCGRPTEKGEALFRIEGGGVFCPSCTETGMVISPETLRVLQRLQRTSIDGVGRIIPSPSARREIDHLLTCYLKYHFDGIGDLKSLNFLNKLGRYVRW